MSLDLLPGFEWEMTVRTPAQPAFAEALGAASSDLCGQDVLSIPRDRGAGTPRGCCKSRGVRRALGEDFLKSLTYVGLEHP